MVGVFGASGYTGRELIRILGRHPQVELGFTTGSGNGHVSHETGLEREAAVFFLCLPHGVSATFAARLRQAHADALVVDLSGDLRLPDLAAYRTWYRQEHPAPALLGRATYGLSEVYRPRIADARLVANPGCYATSVLLALVPLLRERLIDPSDIVVDAKSGATGAGRALREELLFAEIADDLSAYSPGRVHRHVGEIEVVLREAAAAEVALTFCPHLVPVKRGILSAIYVKGAAPSRDLADALRRFYAGSLFVRVVEAPPRLSDVVGTNDCLISVHAASPGRAVIFSALDNLLKGAAGQAVQNLNLAMGLREQAGLPVRGE